MTSVRKSVKAAKRKIKELQAEDVPQDRSIRVMALLYANKWEIAGELFSVWSIRTQARMKAFTRRNERKIKKQGKWAEYREFVAYQKRIQASMIPPFLLDDSPTIPFEYWINRKHAITSKNE